MKNFSYIFLFIFLLIDGCKKANNCNGLVCQSGGNCADGVCVCVNGFTGVHCETAPHYPTDSVEGNYLVTSYHYSWTMTHDHDTSYTTYNDTLRIARIDNDSIFTNYVSVSLGYDSNYPDTTVNNFNQHVFQGSSANYFVKFFRNNPDSVDASFSGGGLGGGGGVDLHGIKIH